MLTKKFIPCIYLYHGNCVKSLKDTTIVETNPVRVANYYNENNADEIIISSSTRLCLKAHELNKKAVGGKDKETFEKLQSYIFNKFKEACE